MNPRLVLAIPVGQTSVRAVFDSVMRSMGPDDVTDPANPLVWTAGGGLPDIVDVVKLSGTEYELVLEAPAPLGSGYSITVESTVKSAAGESIDPAFVTASFDVVTEDLTVSGFMWVSSSVLDIMFSSSLSPLPYEELQDLVGVQPVTGGRQVQVMGVEQSGSSLRVTLRSAGTCGAQYLLTVDRQKVFSAVGVQLKVGEDSHTIWGQGAAPSFLSTVVTETSLQATCSEALGAGSDSVGLPQFLGAYSTDKGGLGSSISSASASVITFPDASFTLGDTISFSASSLQRSVAVGQSMLGQSSSSLGAGTESVGVGSTTLAKTSGAPFEVVFSGGSDTLSRTGRRVTTSMSFTFAPSTSEYQLLAITLLNTQVSLVFKKLSNNLVSLQFFRGSKPIGSPSDGLALSSTFSLSITDATSDNNGFLAAAINNQVVLGATAKDALDPLLIGTSVGATALALVLGSPAAPTQTFSVTFSSGLSIRSFLTSGLRGQDSRDLLSFSSVSSVVVVSPDQPSSNGYAGTGKPAFGVYAEYIETQDTIQVVVALNAPVAPSEFSGSITLMTANQQPVDQILFDHTSMLAVDHECVAFFMHPRMWAGCLVGVAIDIGDDSFSTVVPIADAGAPVIYGQLTQQPSSWGHVRLPKQNSLLGPAVIMNLS